MYPSGETMEYASTRLVSFWQIRMVAEKMAVAAPTTATTAIEAGARRKSALVRATMYTPAVTIVAAWMRAETGGGPSIPSGGPTARGGCADFPTAAPKGS